ncbi:hypothetical protein GCM10022204_40640 [Microlunatus aurantiacus]|uniref:Integral membrane protein n=1 Tax=Microlunatus aurantiacus TaxID=446786 RepID=A0ABP7EB59_9ACTN
MVTSPPRPRLLVALQTEATVLMSLAIGQAGLAAGFLGGQGGLRPVHGVNAYALLAVTVAIILTAVAHRRSGGPRWPVLAGAILLVVETLQLTLARFDVVGLHIFCGVLFVVLATLLTSYLFRPGNVSSTARPAVRG